MLERHGKEYAFSPKEIGCVDPKIVEPMVTFTIDNVPWNLKPIPVPRAHIPKLSDLLKEKVAMGILDRHMHQIQIGGLQFQRRMGHCGLSKICN